MWVFDGEEWTQDGAAGQPAANAEQARRRWEEMTPELQVVEIVPVKRDRNVPPFPAV